MDDTKKIKKAKNKKRKLALRIIISIMLIVFFATNINLKETFWIIAESNWPLILCGIIIYLGGQCLSAYKWSIISKAIGFTKKYSEYITYYYIGMFFNLFLPTTVGGDVGKAYYLSKGDSNVRKAPAIYTVLAERMSGLAVLSWLGTTAMLTPIGNGIPNTIKFISIAISIAVIIGPPLFPIFIKAFFSSKNWLNRSMMKDVMVFWEYKLVLKCLWWSLLFHCLVIIIHMLIGLAIGLEVPLLYYCAIYPIVAIIGFIPISFNGIGVREGAYIYLLSLAGAQESAAFAFGIIWFAVVLVASLIGGIVYIKGHHTRVPEEFDSSELSLDSIADDDNEFSEVNQKNLNVPSELISPRN